MAQTTEQFHQALDLLQENTAPLWPDFTPARTPFLAFDGQDSWLFHADPPSPDGWQRQAGHWSFAGRHPQLRANTAVLLGDLLPAATILLSELPGQLIRIPSNSRISGTPPDTRPSPETRTFSFSLRSDSARKPRGIQSESV